MKEITVMLYGEATNNAVLKLPDRTYPGVLIQGDTLKNILEISEVVAKLASRQANEELADEAEGLFEMLQEIYQGYLNETKKQA